MANQNGIAIIIKAWLPTGKTLDEQLSALTIVKAAHESSDYAPLLAAAKIEAVSTESKTRRMGENPTTAMPQTEQLQQPPSSTSPSAEASPSLSASVADGSSLMPGNFLGENPHEPPAPTDVPDMSKVRTAADGRAAKKKAA